MAADPTSSRSSGDGRVVLVVDDDEAIVELIVATLRNSPYQVITANDGDEAYEIALREQPRVILLDVAMPGLNGFEACRKIKSNPLTRDAWVIMLTARTQPEDRALSVEVGANGYIAKPFRPSQLLAAIGDRLGL